jgi:hypothetical protein
MIRHTVVFRLKHKKGSPEEQTFLNLANELKAISTVKKFECLVQVSKKNNFDFGLSMEFDTQQDYDTYDQHPDHQHFVQTYWIPQVEEFMEIDYQVM